MMIDVDVDAEVVELANKARLYATALLEMMLKKHGENPATVLMTAAQFAAHAIFILDDEAAGRRLLAGGIDAALKDIKDNYERVQHEEEEASHVKH